MGLENELSVLTCAAWAALIQEEHPSKSRSSGGALPPTGPPRLLGVVFYDVDAQTQIGTARCSLATRWLPTSGKSRHIRCQWFV